MENKGKLTIKMKKTQYELSYLLHNLDLLLKSKNNTTYNDEFLDKFTLLKKKLNTLKKDDFIDMKFDFDEDYTQNIKFQKSKNLPQPIKIRKIDFFLNNNNVNINIDNIKNQRVNHELKLLLGQINDDVNIDDIKNQKTNPEPKLLLKNTTYNTEMLEKIKREYDDNKIQKSIEILNFDDMTENQYKADIDKINKTLEKINKVKVIISEPIDISIIKKNVDDYVIITKKNKDMPDKIIIQNTLEIKNINMNDGTYSIDKLIGGTPITDIIKNNNGYTKKNLQNKHNELKKKIKNINILYIQYTHYLNIIYDKIIKIYKNKETPIFIELSVNKISELFNKITPLFETINMELHDDHKYFKYYYVIFILYYFFKFVIEKIKKSNIELNSSEYVIELFNEYLTFDIYKYYILINLFI